MSDSAKSKDLLSRDSNPIMDRNADRFRILQLFTILSLIQAPFYSLFYWLTGSPAASLIIAVSIPFLLLTFWIGKKSGSPALAGNWIIATGFLIFFASAFFTGGLQAPAMTWSIAIPIVACLICGARSGIVWAALVAAKFSFFFWYVKLGGEFMQQYSAPGYHAAYYATILGIAFFALFLGLISEYHHNRYAEKLEKSNRSLRQALENIDTLQGLLPMCAWCKKIRNDRGYWDQVEVYIKQRSNVEFSHGICPECERIQRAEWKKSG